METHQGAGCLSYAEGGTGASVKYITPSDNRGAGSYVGSKVSKLPDGAKIKIVVE
ncbi:Sporulation-specific extracellular nuclease precursor [Bacillus paranthracis]|nr:Sporulation-specific extracellular nuclease precursor [Bacillus paranthracis]